MMIIFAFIFSFFYFRILGDNNKVHGVNLFSSYSFSFYLYYVVVPAVIEILTITNIESKVFFDVFFTNRGMPQLLYCVIVSLFFSLLVVTYKYNSRNNKVIVNYNKLFKYAKLIGLFSLFAGSITLIIYFKSLGGFVPALAMAEFARSMAYDMTDIISIQQVRLVIIIRLLILSPFCFFVMGDIGKRNNLIILLSILFTYVFLLFNASRTIIAIFTVALAFPMLSKISKHPWLLIIISTVFGSNILNLLDALFLVFNDGSNLEVNSFDLNNILMQFSFAYRNALNAFEIVDFSGCRFFSDLITSFLNFIPGLTFQPSTEPTSQFWGGSDWRLTGGVPNDIITYSVLEGHIIGLVLFPILIGKILCRIDSTLLAISRDGNELISKIVKPYILLALFFCIPSADLQSILENYTIFVFFMIFYLSSNKVRSLSSVNNCITPLVSGEKISNSV